MALQQWGASTRESHHQKILLAINSRHRKKSVNERFRSHKNPSECICDNVKRNFTQLKMGEARERVCVLNNMQTRYCHMCHVLSALFSLYSPLDTVRWKNLDFTSCFFFMEILFPLANDEQRRGTWRRSGWWPKEMFNITLFAMSRIMMMIIFGIVPHHHRNRACTVLLCWY